MDKRSGCAERKREIAKIKKLLANQHLPTLIVKKDPVAQFAGGVRNMKPASIPALCP